MRRRNRRLQKGETGLKTLPDSGLFLPKPTSMRKMPNFKTHEIDRRQYCNKFVTLPTDKRADMLISVKRFTRIFLVIRAGIALEKEPYRTETRWMKCLNIYKKT